LKNYPCYEVYLHNICVETTSGYIFKTFFSTKPHVAKMILINGHYVGFGGEIYKQIKENLRYEAYTFKPILTDRSVCYEHSIKALCIMLFLH